MAVITPFAAEDAGEMAVTACTKLATNSTLIELRKHTGPAIFRNRVACANPGIERGTARRDGGVTASSSASSAGGSASSRITPPS